jgi:hypothetical protein
MKSKQEVIEMMESALKEMEELCNRIGEGDITFSEAGDIIHSVAGDETCMALKRGLEKLREEK